MGNEKSQTSELWYLMSGVAIGTVLGILFAPKKGSETRDDLSDWARVGSAKSRGLMAELSARLPFKVKAAAVFGAVKAGGAEALEMMKENHNHDGTEK